MRALTSAFDTAIVSPVFKPVFLVQIAFSSGVAAWNSGFRDMVHEGITYRPAGHLGGISAIQEAGGVKAAGVTLTLSGIKPEIMALVKDQPILDRPCRVYLALLDDGENFSPDRCKLAFVGSLDTASCSIGSSASINLAVKSRLADWERPRKLRYTDADQQKLYPGDRGMEYIPQMSQKKLIWPRAAFLPDPRD